MSSALCCKNYCRHLLRLLLLLLCLVLLMPAYCRAGRIGRAAFLDDNTQVRSVVVDPNNRTIWNMFNLTDAQVRRIQNHTNPSSQDENTQTSTHRHLQHVASRRVNEIFNLIRIAVTNQSDGNGNKDSLVASSPSQTQIQKTLHEKAGYPICNADTSIMNWQQSTNVTLQFANSIFQRSSGDSLSLDSALLRLYKIDPNNKAAKEEPTSETTICPEPQLLESQIRVTVSIVHQQKKKRKLERKKRTCNTVMLSSSKIGWVDIDVKCALNYWEQQHCQHSHSPLPASVTGMLMIEVHDDEENQLKPGLYFEPPKCDQADPAIPWTVYGAKTPVPCLENRTMPRYPRLDVRFTGDAQFVSLADESTLTATSNNNNNNNTSNIDNMLDDDDDDDLSNNDEISEEERLELQQQQQHRRRHHHSQRETTDHRHHHHHNNHHSHHNHHQLHHHLKHHHVLAHKQQQQQQQQQQQE